MSSRTSTTSEVQSLNERVSAIEDELARLRGLVQGASNVPRNGWRLAIEKYAGDEDLQSIFKEAMKLREADRKRARRPRAVRRAKQ